MALEITYILAKFFHDIATITWIGGLFSMGFVVLPSTKKVFEKKSDSKKLMETIQHRLSILVYISIILLIVTGLMLAKHSGLYLGIVSLGNEYSTLTTIKHVLYVTMLLITLTRSQFLDMMKLNHEKKVKVSVLLLFANIVLGFIVVFLSAVLTNIAGSV
ncbi:MAG: hypothetical protein KAT16_09815 [Candidatus Heimdallarchaeota archaeon]|nr:hypothetical protein [Candidatus Heimdallarchaeota archaeon]